MGIEKKNSNCVAPSPVAAFALSLFRSICLLRHVEDIDNITRAREERLEKAAQASARERCGQVPAESPPADRRSANRRRRSPICSFQKKLTLPCSPSGPLPPCRRERSPSRRRHRRCCCWQRRRRPRSPGRRGSSSRRRTRRPAAGRQTRRPGDGRPVVIGFFFGGERW